MKIVKIILLTIVSLVLLLVIGLVAAINLIDLNRHHDRIAKMVHEQTGRELRIEGDFSWGLWPRLHLAGGPLVLGNAPGFGPEPFLSLESFSFSVATWPLRRSEIHLDALQVSGLELNLERNPDGIGNWEDLAGEPEPDRPHAKPERHEGMPFAALALGGVNIDRVNLNWHDHSSGQQAQIRDLRLNIGPLSFGDPIQLELDFTAASNQPKLEVAARAQATLLYDLRAERYAIEPLKAKATFSGPTVPGERAELTLHTLFNLDGATGRAELSDFRLEGLGALVQAQVAMHDLEAAIPGCQGEVTVDIADLVALLEVFESPLGRQLADVRERSIAVATEFSLDPHRGRVMVPHLEARLLGTTISGRLEADDIHSNQPRVQGGLRADGPDLPALLAIAARLQPGADQDALARALAGLTERSLLAEATFASEGEEIVIPHLHLRGLATELTLAGRLGQLTAELPTVTGKVTVEGRNLPLLLKVASAFQGGPTPAANGEGGAGAELWALADRIAAARQNSFNLASDFNAQPAAERLSLSNFKATALGLESRVNLNAQGIISAPRFEAELALAPFNARRLLTILGVELPETTDPAALTRLSLKAEAAGSPERFTVRPLQATLDDSDIQGELTVNDRERPDLAFKIAIDQIDLDRYLPPESDEQPVTPETAAAGTALLPVELLRPLRLDGDLRIGKLKLSGLQIEDFILGVKADEGLIKVEPLGAALYQGTMSGSTSIDARPEIPEIRTNNRLSGIQVGPLLRDLTGKQERIRGRAEISYQLNTRGQEVDEFKANLGGEARFSFQDGAVVGVNIGRLLRQTSALAQGRTLSVEERDAVTDFTTLSGSAQIKDGLISNRDLSMMSPLLRLSGQGTANLVSEEIDYLLTTTAVATAEGQEGRDLAALRGISVPIRVSGTFDNPRYRPELGSGGLQQLRDNLQQLGDQLRQEGVRALEGLLAPREQPPAEEQPETGPEESSPQDRLQDGLRRLFR